MKPKKERISVVIQTPKPCAAWAEKLAARHNEDLSASERAALAEHIAGCANCAAVNASYARITARAQLASSPQLMAQPATTFRENLYAPIEAQPVHETARNSFNQILQERRRARSRRTLLKNIALVAVVACVILVSAALFHPSSLTTTGGGASKSTLHPQGHSIVGAPTISVRQINAILATYRSPAAGKGQALYDLGVKYQIDPVFALAIFHHESTMGTRGEARATLSLGNLRCIPDHECIDQNRGGYAKMKSWEDGFNTWYALMHKYYVVERKLDTVEKIIPVYAPTAIRSHETTYINFINHDIATWHSGKIVMPAASE